MKTVKALVAFSNGVISMEQYQVRSLPTDMANDLIAAGICVEAEGGSGGGVLVLNVTVDNATGEATLNKTWNEIYTASATMPIIIVLHKDGVGERFTQYILVDRVTNSNRETGTRQYTVYAHIELLSDNNPIAFIADSEDGYPSATLE